MTFCYLWKKGTELCKASSKKFLAKRRSTLTTAVGNNFIFFVMGSRATCFCTHLRHNAHHSSVLRERLLFSLFPRHPIPAEVSTGGCMKTSQLYFIQSTCKLLSKVFFVSCLFWLLFQQKHNMAKDLLSFIFLNYTYLLHSPISLEYPPQFSLHAFSHLQQAIRA